MEEKFSGIDGKENEGTKGRRKRRASQGDRSVGQKGNPGGRSLCGFVLKEGKEVRCSPGTQGQRNHSSSVTNPYLYPSRSSHACRVEITKMGVLADP